MKRIRLILVSLPVIILSLFTTPITVSGQSAGSLDPGFGSGGKLVTDNGFLDLYQAVAVQTDGKIVAAGTFYDAIWSASIQVVRLLEDGSYDPSFGNDGIFTYHMNYETGAYGCYIRNDGKILIAGITTDNLGAFAMLVLKLDQTGNLDPDFGVGGVSYLDLGPGEDIAYAITQQDDEKILLAGYSNNENYLNAPVVVRLNPDGSLDGTFGTNGVATVPVTEMDNEFACIGLQSDGKIVAAGHISNGLSWFSLLAARFDQEGNPDPSFGTDGVVNLNLNNVDDEFFGMQVLKDDRIMLTGFTTVDGTLDYHMLAMRLTPEGAADPTFSDDGILILGNNPFMVGNALVIQPDDKIIIAGTSGDKTPSNNDWCLWRLNDDGTSDASFGQEGTVTTEFYGEPDEARALALTGDRIVVAGKARNGGQNFNFAIARYLNDIGVSVPALQTAGELKVFPDPAACNSTIRVQLPTDITGPSRLMLSDLSGRIIWTKDQDENGKTIDVQLPASIGAGVYTLGFEAGDRKEQVRLVLVNP